MNSCVCPAGKSSDRDDGESSGQETDEETAPHTFARQLQYPSSTVKRFPVPEEKVSWEVPDINYMTYLTKLSNVMLDCLSYVTQILLF